MKQQGRNYFFSDLDNGDVFVHDYSFCMKIDFPNTAINLGTGKTLCFFDQALCKFWETGVEMLKKGGRA